MVLLLATLSASGAHGQCSSDISPRWTWSYPGPGEAVSRYAPLLWRFVGAPQGPATYSVGSLVDQPLAPLTTLSPWTELALSGVAGAVALPADGGVQVKLPTSQAVTLALGFTTLGAEVVPARETLELVVRDHYVGTDVDLPSERCRSIVFAHSGEPCWGAPGIVSIGFDVELQAVAADGERRPAQTAVRAFAVVPEDHFLGTGSSRPRPWPPECGPPRFFTSLDLDQPERCFRVVAFVDALTNAGKVVRSSPYCLGGGAAWPEPMPAPVDAGADAMAPSGPPWSPATTTGPVPCGCPPCPGGSLGPIACDGPLRVAGAAGDAGASRDAAAPRDGGAGRGESAATGADAVVEGMGGDAADDRARAGSGSCGCRVGRESSSSRQPVLMLLLWFSACALLRSLPSRCRGRAPRGSESTRASTCAPRALEQTLLLGKGLLKRRARSQM